MRVLVTGATGFIGAHTVDALNRGGHEIEVFVRDKAKLDAALEPFEARPVAVHVGDFADGAAITNALDGCDAVIHCAAKVSLDSSDAESMIETNLRGTRNVLGSAVAAGIDPIVHLSSITAVYPPSGHSISPDDPVTEGLSAYGRSKAQCETYARSLQADGHPVVIFYPGGVLGPHCAGSYEMLDGIRTMFGSPMLPIPRGGHTTIIDVRDLAEVIARTIEPGLGPRRFMAGGRWTSFQHWIDLLAQTSGRSFRTPALPGIVLRGFGRMAEQYASLRGSEPIMTYEQSVIMTRAAPCDDSAIFEQLDAVYRPLQETIEDVVRWAVKTGRIPVDSAPRLAD
ncbi:MAG: SDR family NAD(P)-dependent oxidoreductase [Acidobacteria bacterium]|nr:SDR family NAD(P)-dependent oxidoreductase [Acidobacteriota bacterium]